MDRPEWLDTPFLGDTVQDWLLALGAALLTATILRIVRAVVTRRLRPLAERSGSSLDDILVDAVAQTRAFLYLAAGALVGASFLTLTETSHTYLRRLALAAIAVQVALWMNTIAAESIASWRRRRDADSPGAQTLTTAARFAARVLVWSITLVTILSIFGVEVGALVAGLGIGGVAAALAVQSVLGDMFASLSLYVDRPFDVGDFIVVGDQMGNVTYVGLRSTRLRALSGEQLVFANSDLTKSRIQNFRRMEERRVLFHLGVVYGTAHDTLREIPELIHDAVEEVEGTRMDRAHFAEFGDYALAFEVVYWILSPDFVEYRERHQAVLLGIHRRFEERGIEFAFPTQTVHVPGVGRSMGEGDGEREAA